MGTHGVSDGRSDTRSPYSKTLHGETLALPTGVAPAEAVLELTLSFPGGTHIDGELRLGLDGDGGSRWSNLLSLVDPGARPGARRTVFLDLRSLPVYASADTASVVPSLRNGQLDLQVWGLTTVHSAVLHWR